MAKNILTFLGCLVVLIVVVAVWRVWLAGPGVALSTQGDHVVVSNVVLGEYYLGFKEVIIRDRSSGKTIWHARQGSGEDIDSLSFRAGLNMAPPRWTILEPKNSDTFTLLPGIDYQLMVWGNNGFSVTKWSGGLVVPSTPSQ
jgi:hypothetical protein